MPELASLSPALGPEAAKGFMRARRSIRTYKDAPVIREKIESLIKTARYAPTGMNSQKVGWLVVGSRAEVARLSGIAVDWMRNVIDMGHPGADAYGFKGIIAAWEAGRDVICRGAPALVLAHASKEYPAAAVDCTIALSYLDLAAQSHGLGTCWAGFFMIALSHWPALRKELNIPAGSEIFGAMMLGEPMHAYHRLPERNEPEITWQG
jgi:nitroreductase